MTGIRYALAVAVLTTVLPVALPGGPTGAAAAGDGEGDGKTGRFVVVSDIHFNPFDPPALASDLAAAEPADWPAIFATVETQRAAQYGSDTNHALLQSTLAALSRANADADFVLVPGDFLAHRFHQKAAAALGVDETADVIRQLSTKTTIYVADELRKAFPDKPVILALGNNDSACGDYRLQPTGSYLARTARTAAELAGPDLLDPGFETTYGTGGYYAMRHPTVADTTILVVSDTLWSAEYDDACAGMDDGEGGVVDGVVDGSGAMLVWLEDRLKQARIQGERVVLIRHIPVGIDPYASLRKSAATCPEKAVPFMRQPYEARAPDLLSDYSDLIVASFAGHIHRDGYRLIGDSGGEVVGMEKIVPAISPVYHQNPGFQVYDYDRETGAPVDFETWYLDDLADVTLANAGDWTREYRFTDAYGLPDFSTSSVAGLWRSFAPGDGREASFSRYYPVSHGTISAAELPAVVCATRYTGAAAFSACYCGG